MITKREWVDGGKVHKLVIDDILTKSINDKIEPNCSTSRVEYILSTFSLSPYTTYHSSK